MNMHDLQHDLEQIEQNDLLRRRKNVVISRGVRIRVDGQELLSFCSNDYLGLANHPALIDAAQQGAKDYGVGAKASHLISGHHNIHDELEKKLAVFVGLPRALLFSTGYMANIAVVTTLVSRSDAVFADKLNHASLNDAVLLSRAKFYRYPHLDLSVLEKNLAQSKAKHKLVVTDAVFSMDGDIAPLPELIALCQRYNAWLFVDDAHGFGVLGKGGRGTLSHFDIQIPNIIYMGTLGKAAGVFGAFVAGQETLIETLIQHAHTYIYTTATPPLLAQATVKSIELIEKEHWRRERLKNLIQILRSQLKLKRWKLLASETPIQPLIIGSNKEALAIGEKLWQQGFWVPVIRPPTVPQGQARLRISLSAAHSEEEVTRLVDAINNLQ